MKKIIISFIIGLFLVSNCYGIDKSILGKSWKSNSQNYDCDVSIDESTEIMDLILSVSCNQKNGINIQFPMSIIKKENGNIIDFGDNNNTFWTVKIHGKNMEVIPKNVDKMDRIEWVGYKKGMGKYTGKSPEVKKLVNDISKMKFKMVD